MMYGKQFFIRFSFLMVGSDLETNQEQILSEFYSFRGLEKLI